MLRKLLAVVLPTALMIGVPGVAATSAAAQETTTSDQGRGPLGSPGAAAGLIGSTIIIGVGLYLAIDGGNDEPRSP